MLRFIYSLVCEVQSAYLKQEHQSLNLSSTPDPHTLNSYSFSNFMNNIQKTRILMSLTALLEKLNYTKFVKISGRAVWLVTADDYESR